MGERACNASTADFRSENCPSDSLTVGELSELVTATMASASLRTQTKVTTDILARTRAPAFLKYLRDLLVELCRVDTTPSPKVERMRRAEDACFRILERELAGLAFPGLRLERRPVNPAIAKHPHYSLLHFTKTASRPAGLSPREVYGNRSNLVCVIPGEGRKQGGASVGLNAHVDVVAPYFPPRVQGGTVFGRGACDDKGPLVGIVGALKVLSETLGCRNVPLNRNVVGMFVVEEETGGNGSLSLAVDRELKSLYDTLVVCECTGLRVHPANRGAVWYRAALKPPRGVSAFEMFAFVNEEMEKEGAAIRTESHHPLFPQRPVQTCHGIIGPFGEHPSRICGEVRFRVVFSKPATPQAEQLLRDCLESGLRTYVGLYGDKSQVADPATGKPMVPKHFEVNRSGRTFRITVHGATGHMGAIRERDGAITKMAHLVRSLVYSRARLEAAAGGRVRFELDERAGGSELVLEGGQGFVPTHSITEVMTRLERAAQRGAESYLRHLGRTAPAGPLVKVTYEKLHNVAFDGDPDSASMRNALAAAELCGLPPQEPVLGWTVSCDARLFATEYPGMEVLTFGPGQLAFAHADQEQIELEEIRKAAEFLALFVLRQTGTGM
jgi:acetylornithine deacetylase/succinyl-diaminopimelate desuccinylase-like protein